MPQYRPVGEAENVPELNRMITGDEYRAAFEAAVFSGLERLDSAGMRYICDKSHLSTRRTYDRE